MSRPCPSLCNNGSRSAINDSSFCVRAFQPSSNGPASRLIFRHRKSSVAGCHRQNFAAQPFLVHVFRQALPTGGRIYPDGLCQFAYDHRGGIDQPDFLGVVGFLAGKQGDGIVDRILLLAELQHIAIGLGVVGDAVGTRKGLNQSVVEFFPRLPVQVFAVNDEQAFFNVWIVLEQGRGFKWVSVSPLPVVCQM
jgi:hypothetical protein